MDDNSIICLPSTGAQSSLAGVSTSYWSYTRMSVADVHELKNVDGLNCIIRHAPTIQFFPVSKCTLVGMIVFAQEKQEQICYILDDGTGFVDCVEWTANPNSINTLPEILQGSEAKLKFGVGDRVRIFGTIQCVRVSEMFREEELDGLVLEISDCVYEIKVDKMQPLQPADSGSTNDLNWEANHWVRGIQATKPATGNNRMGLRNAINTLEWLGPTITEKVKNGENFPSHRRRWRPPGVKCTCQLSYIRDLLYCHCNATVEPLDPNFEFRDALLNHLLRLERNHQKRQQQWKNPQLDLRFQYSTVANHAELCEIAERVVLSNGNSELNGPDLFRATFRALRQDGILSLLQEASDTYLLLSRKGVLEPFIHRRLLRNNKKRRRSPCYLQDVSWDKLNYVESGLSGRPSKQQKAASVSRVLFS